MLTDRVPTASMEIRPAPSCRGLLLLLGVSENMASKLPDDAHTLYLGGIERLMASGVPQYMAARVMAALELGRQSYHRCVDDAPILNSPEAAEWFKPVLQGQSTERLWGLFLDRRGRVLARRQLSSGSACATLFDVTHILREGLLVNACAFVVAHNHPSGDLFPSEEDKAVTAQLVIGAKAVRLKFQDHLIFGPDGTWISLVERGYM